VNDFWRNVVSSATLILVYFLAGKFGLSFFGHINPSASAVWLPTGVAIAALLVLGYRVWPAIFFGAFLVNVTTAGSIASSLGVAAGNTLEGVIAAYLVNRFAGGRGAFSRPADILKFACLAGLLSTTVSATIGVTSLALGGYAARPELATIWLTWWLGDAAGAMLVTPLLVLWYTNRAWRWPAARLLEGALLLVSIGVVGGVVFFHPLVATYPLAFLCVAPLVWAALRFGPREVATAIALLSVIATAATATGHGSFALQTPNESLLVLQVFMALMAMTALPMAAQTAERAGLLKRERAARAQADAASRAKDEFLATLSHELRNPLSAISAAATVLDDNEHVPRGEPLRWLRVIQRQTQHLARLIDDLLDIARVTVNKISLRMEPVNLSSAVERSVRAFTSAGFVHPSRIDLQLENTWVNADPDRVAQIINNLVGNAIKYTAPEGRIRVTVCTEGQTAVLRVEDDGAGISTELLPHVFDAFTQGEQGVERRAGGLGIGLTLVRRLTELHGGSVSAHSEGPGRGSVFVVRLPSASEPAQVTVDERPQRSMSSRTYRLLVIEDNSDARQALRMLLENDGHEVHEAADGEAGVAAALQLAPDLVLVDIGLPRLDGYAVARQLRAANREIRLIALTGYGRDEDKARAEEVGFDAHLLKPVGIERLRVIIEETLSRGSALRSEPTVLDARAARP
jgi:signal transduction histidine kinase/ActR/RegA family two-component response regulator